MSTKKWPLELIVKFLEAYEAHRCLWDLNDKSYKDRICRDQAYEAISRQMQLPGFEAIQVKAKIRTLRNAYTLELNKIEKSKKAGPNFLPNGVYKPVLKWFPLADRILKQVVQIKEIQLKDASFLIPESMMNPAQSTSENEEDEQETTEEPVEEDFRTKRFKQENGFSSGSSLNGKCDEDEFEMFGRMVTCQLNKLPEEDALEAMAHIHLYLMRKRLKVIARLRARDSEPVPSYSSSPGTYDGSDEYDEIQEHRRGEPQVVFLIGEDNAEVKKERVFI